MEGTSKDSQDLKKSWTGPRTSALLFTLVLAGVSIVLIVLAGVIRTLLGWLLLHTATPTSS